MTRAITVSKRVAISVSLSQSTINLAVSACGERRVRISGYELWKIGDDENSEMRLFIGFVRPYFPEQFGGFTGDLPIFLRFNDEDADRAVRRPNVGLRLRCRVRFEIQFQS